MVGVAHEATLVGYRVFSYISDHFISQIGRAIEQGADVVSMSLGSQFSSNFFDRALDPAVMT